MSESEYRDYNIRVCNDNTAVLMDAFGFIEYNNSYYEWGKYLEEEHLKINTHNEAIRSKVMNLCNNIATQLIELNYILDDIEKDNEENGE